ncbi:MAG: methylated-DNA--[protein]-cysteine S-methyltransferase [Prevotella sp.]
METIIYHTPLGDMLIGSQNNKLCLCCWTTDATGQEASLTTASVLAETCRQLDEYFAGKRISFQLPIEARGTAFQQKVWNALTQIPNGSTVSYSQIADYVGIPKAFRAVAQACHNNPIAIIIPCHRVIGLNGKLTGYAGGIERKRLLLALECEAQSLQNIEGFLIN